MRKSSRSEKILGPREPQVVLHHVTLNGFCGVSCTLLCSALRDEGLDWQKDSLSAAVPACGLIRDAMSGRPVNAPAVSAKSSAVSADFVVWPSAEEPLCYDVRYELQLEADAAGRGQISGERISYVERRADAAERRRKAFDTISAGRYEGIRPLDICELIARRREDRAALSALRILCASSRRSFLFSPEFAPYAARTVHLRPGAFFLRTLQAFAKGGMQICPKVE